MPAGENLARPVHPKASEDRLQAIRQEASATGKVSTGAGRANVNYDPNAPIAGAENYYGHGVVKPPTWTWEVALYFFVGGISGFSSVIAFVGHLFRADPAMLRVALWIAMVGTILCPVLLISDLGRPS